MLFFLYFIGGVIAFYGIGFLIASVCSTIMNKRDEERNAKYVRIRKAYKSNPRYFDENPSDYDFYEQESRKYHFEHSAAFLRQMQQEQFDRFCRESAQFCMDSCNQAMDDLNTFMSMNNMF